MAQRAQQPKLEIGTIAIDPDITLRRMVVRPAEPKETVLLLHGFPETLYAWKDIALALADDYEVHAFDWPGFGFSSRPPVDRFSYAPRDYARILKNYIVAPASTGRGSPSTRPTSGPLPVLLLALEEADIAKSLIVCDFAPFNRLDYMSDNLRALKSKPASDRIRDFMNANREEILANVFWRGLPKEAHYDISREFRDEMADAWSHGDMTPVDTLYHYYSHFTRDQELFEASLANFATPVTVVWGREDPLIKKEMGIELADRIQARLKLLSWIGHYPHLQAPSQAIDEIRASFR